MYNFREGILFHIFPVLILFKNDFLLLIVCSTADVCFGYYMSLLVRIYLIRSASWLLFEKLFEPVNLVYPGLSCFDLMMYVPIHAKEK